MLKQRRALALVLTGALLPLNAGATAYTCVSFDYPPLIRKTDAAPEGFAVDVVTRVFAHLGHSVTVRLYPWERALTMIRLGQADCIFTLYRSAERAEYLDYSREVLAQQAVYLYARENAQPAFNGDLRGVRGIRTGVVRGINYGPRFELARATLDLQETSTIEQNFMKLAVGRVDLVPSNMHTAMATMARPSLQALHGKLVRLPVPIEVVPSYIGFQRARKLAALRDAFDTALKKFAATEEYRLLLEKYHLEATRDLPGAVAN